jgi:hypothetical protein
MSLAAPADRRVGCEWERAARKRPLYAYYHAGFQQGTRHDRDPAFADVHGMSANFRHSETAKRHWNFDWAAEVATVLPQDQTIRGS